MQQQKNNRILNIEFKEQTYFHSDFIIILNELVIYTKVKRKIYLIIDTKKKKQTTKQTKQR